MNNLFFAIHPNVTLHAKIPLVSLFGLMHLGIAFLVLILCLGRGRNNRGGHNRSISDFDPLRLEMLVQRRKNLFADAFLFDEMTEFADRRLIRRSLCLQRALQSRSRIPNLFDIAGTGSPPRTSRTARFPK
jgi:hypothetical protein